MRSEATEFTWGVGTFSLIGPRGPCAKTTATRSSSSRAAESRNEVFLLLRHRPEQAAFKDAALLLGRVGGEGVPRVQAVVAEQEVERAVVGVRGRLRDDLDAPAAPARILHRVGVVVDADLLDGRGRDARVPHLHPIDDNGRSGTARRAGIEKPAQCGQVV